MESKRIIYFDYLRVIAVFSVIVLHVAAQNWHNADTNTFEWNVFNFYDGASRCAVPLFVMISGALFLGREYSLDTLYRKHVLKMLIVFVFWTIAYSVWGYWISGSVKTGKELLMSILVGWYHLWFIRMIIGLYMIVPLLNQIVKDYKHAFYFLTLSFFFSFLMPQTISIIDFKYRTLSQILSKALSDANIHFIIGYSGYYVLGYLLHNIELKRKQLVILYLLGFCGLLFTIGATAVISIYLEKPKDYFYDYFTVNILTVAVAGFLLAKHHLNFTNLSAKRERLLFSLSKYSFGIYLVHVIVLEGLKEFLNITTLSLNAALSVPVISISVFAISYIISAVLNRIPIVKQWIV